MVVTHTEQERTMVAYFESKGFKVSEINTYEHGKIIVTWDDGTKSTYYPIKF